MAVETKVGLLVGLAFIVCFGIILTHRGSGDRMSSDVALELLSRHHAASIVPQGLSLGNFYKRSETNRPPSRSRWSQSLNSLIRPERRESQPANIQDARQQDPDVRAGSVDERAKRTTEPTKGGTHPTWESLFADDSTEAEDTDDPRADEIETRRDPKPKRARTMPKTAPKRFELPTNRKSDKQYVVRKGDTMWSIARSSYGKGTRAIVDAIFAANRDKLRSPDRLVDGVELSLPVIE